MIPTRNQPPYVERGLNNLLLATPAIAQSVSLYIFPVPSDVQKQQSVCDKFLNDPSRASGSPALADRHAFNYRAFVPGVFLFFAHYAALRSKVSPDRDRGYISYDESGIWIPTTFIRTVKGVPFASHLALFPYYMFVSAESPLATGRELQGWNKETAKVEIESVERPDELTTSPIMVKRFVDGDRAEESPLLRLTKVADGSWSWLLGQLGLAGRSVVQSVRNVIDGDARPTVPGPGLPLSVMRILFHGLTFTFLKQFRDIANPEHACYQAGIEARLQPRLPPQALRCLGNYNLEISHADSHPVATDLGLDKFADDVSSNGSVTFSTIPGFLVKMDFTVYSGSELWRRP
jgi:hypothetical protein